MALNTAKCFHVSFGSGLDASDLTLKDSTGIPSAEEYVVLGVIIIQTWIFIITFLNIFTIN